MRKKLLIIAICMTVVLAACQNNSVHEQTDSETTLAANVELESTTVPEETEPETLYAGDFGEPVPAAQDVSDGDYILVDDIEEGYVEETEEMIYLDAAASPLLEIGGLKEPSENYGEYYRLDADNKEAYSYFNEAYAADSTGGTIRFRTNADRIAVDMKVYATVDFPHVTDRGSFGIDIYTGTGSDRHYCGGLMQFMSDNEELYDVIELPGGYQEVMIDLPQIAGVVYFHIGFPKGCEVAEPTTRTHGPILFYGSSVTQGTSTSRPGNAYTNILCRVLDCDCINLGFSGSDLGEQVIADYITTRDFDIFVMDYNNNASVEILTDTHYNFYKTVREAKPDVPILLLNKPYFTAEMTPEEVRKEEIIQETYDRAIAEGDENIYILSATAYFPEEARDLYTVDMVHPNDLGHYHMARAIFPVLYGILEK